MIKAIWEELSDIILATISGVLSLIVLMQVLPTIGKIFAIAIKSFIG